MKVIRPSFWNQFQCIGGKCTDNCCIGWEIDIDPETMRKYRKVPGELGERLKNSIQMQEGENSFRMNGERCPFLNPENLCDLILGLGEGALCEICREHPRFYEWFGTWKEAGLGLCCEEAVRLLTEEKQPLKFEIVQDDEEESESVENIWLSALMRVRTMIFEMLQNRGKTLRQRMGEVLELTEWVQECMDREDEEGLERIIESGGIRLAHEEEETEIPDMQLWKSASEKLLDIYSGMEAMDKKWPERLNQIRASLDELYVNLPGFISCEKEWAYEWEHLMVYSVFRYFLKGIDDEDILSKVRMAVAGCSMIRLLHLDSRVKNGELGRWDRICNIKAYSKELEYSLENLEKLMDAMWEEEIKSVLRVF